MIDALVGFSSAYARVTRRADIGEDTHSLTVVGLKKGSSRILIDVIGYVTQHPQSAGVLLTGMTALGGGAAWAIKTLAGVIRGKKHLQGRPVNNNFTFNGTNSGAR